MANLIAYELLPRIFNMSVTAGIVILFVLLARLLLRRAPKVFSYALWSVVLFRLLCPVSLSAGFSLLGLVDMPTRAATPHTTTVEYAPPDIVHAEDPQVQFPVEPVRTAVNGALEQARADKTIGKSLEAEVDLTVPAEDAFLSQMEEGALADLLIVSQVRVETGDSLSVTVRPAAGTKCQRCWKHHPLVGANAAHPTLCPRCAKVVQAIHL